MSEGAETATSDPGQRVTCFVEDGVADVRLNRPEKLNALDMAMFAALATVGEQLASDSSVRAVVLSGTGRGFCAGLDFSSFEAMRSSTPVSSDPVGSGDADDDSSSVAGLGKRRPGQLTNLAQRVVHVWSLVPVPVIAAVHGAALGGGLQLVLGADLRIVAPDVKMSVLEIRWGLIPDMTGTWLLPRLVGLDVAKDLTWTGRMVDGAEALRIGLATRVADDPLKESLELARQLARSSPTAIRAAKRLLDGSGAAKEVEQYRRESEEMSDLIGSTDQVEAVTAFFERRAPTFAT